MILMTKKGFKLWGSGMLVVIMSVLFTFLMTEEYLENVSLAEMAIVILVLYPLAIGWAQRWYWTRGDSDDEPAEL